MDFVAVYITTKDLEEARKIGETLVRERLLGCVNIIPKIESIYWWKGSLEKENEALVIGKTRKSLINKTMDRIKGKRFKMGFCVDCHKSKGANLDCWLACHS